MAAEIRITKDPLKLKIPMKPYVVKFLIKKFGKNHKASRTSWLGKSIVNLLTADYNKQPKHQVKSSFTLLIPYTLCLTYGHFIDYSKYPDFASLCEKVFQDFMFDHISINATNGNFGEQMNSLRTFLAFYDIGEDELKLDSTYRHYLRVQGEKKHK